MFKTIQNLTFSVVAEDTVNQLKKYSPTLTVEIYMILDPNPPTITMPANFQMFTNETKIIELPEPTDLDTVDKPVISGFSIQSTS
jgi:hypothetical protein